MTASALADLGRRYDMRPEVSDQQYFAVASSYATLAWFATWQAQAGHAREARMLATQSRRLVAAFGVRIEQRLVPAAVIDETQPSDFECMDCGKTLTLRELKAHSEALEFSSEVDLEHTLPLAEHFVILRQDLPDHLGRIIALIDRVRESVTASPASTRSV